MPKEIRKITHGFVIQKWDLKSGKFLGQDFVAGDDVSYENEVGEPMDETDVPEYRPFDMVQG